MTPLHFAVEVGAEHIVNFLVDKGLYTTDHMLYSLIILWRDFLTAYIAALDIERSKEVYKLKVANNP